MSEPRRSARLAATATATAATATDATAVSEYIVYKVLLNTSCRQLNLLLRHLQLLTLGIVSLHTS